MKATEKMLQALAVTVELTGTQLSKAGARVMADELAQYQESGILAALVRCRRELKGRLTVADVLDRMPHGHPGVEEAWSICGPTLHNEAISVVWTDEIAGAMGAARHLSDPVAARMAFKEVYSAAIAQARLEGRMPRWSASLGTDKSGRELAVLDAAEKGRISVDYARLVLPYHREDQGLSARLLALTSRAFKQLPSEVQ